MQRLFAEGGPWPTPWMPRVLPTVEKLVTRAPERTIFTRFIPPLCLCSSSDEAHEASLRLYAQRCDVQIELADSREILDGWWP